MVYDLTCSRMKVSSIELNKGLSSNYSDPRLKLLTYGWKNRNRCLNQCSDFESQSLIPM